MKILKTKNFNNIEDNLYDKNNFSGIVQINHKNKIIKYIVLKGVIIDQPYKFCGDYVEKIINNKCKLSYTNINSLNKELNKKDSHCEIIKEIPELEIINKIKLTKEYNLTVEQYFYCKSTSSIMEDLYED